jgi:AhpD family alkylhydroperoxidase
MDAKTKELVAIGASIAGHCQPCLEHHLGKARELKVDEDDIGAVVSLAKIISENGDKRMLEFTEDLLRDDPGPSEKRAGKKPAKGGNGS